MITLRIRQTAAVDGKHDISLTLKRDGRADFEAQAQVEFTVSPQEEEELRWYMEDFFQRTESVAEARAQRIEGWMKRRGEELYTKVFEANQSTRDIWFAVRGQLAVLRVEIATGVAEAGSVPWELMREPQSDAAIALDVQSFVRVASNPNLRFVPVPGPCGEYISILFVACRPFGRNDVAMRAAADRLLRDENFHRYRCRVDVLRPPTFEELQKELTRAKTKGYPYHIVHFDGYCTFEDFLWPGSLNINLAESLNVIRPNSLTIVNIDLPDAERHGKRGCLLFEHPGGDHSARFVYGSELGKLLRDCGIPVLVLNACQSTIMDVNGATEAAEVGDKAENKNGPKVRDEACAISSLAQAVMDHGIPGVLGMKYGLPVETAVQYLGQLYRALGQGRPFGQAASESRKRLAAFPDRWLGLESRSLQDWFAPVAFEAAPIRLLPAKLTAPEWYVRPYEPDRLSHVPDTGFVGRDEALVFLERAFEENPVVLLHAHAGQGKSATADVFGRWVGIGVFDAKGVLRTSFETHVEALSSLTDVLNHFAHFFDWHLKHKGIEWGDIYDDAERRRTVLQTLQHKHFIWIWDNVELVACTGSAWTPEEQAALADFLKQIKLDRAIQAKILLISRRDEQEWLGDIPRRVALPRMSNSDAASLARSRSLERHVSREELADWQPLLDYCRGNPLALHVLVNQAMRLGLRGRKQIEKLVESIRSGELAIEDVSGKQDRDKSLDATLDYSFGNAFSEDEQPVIALLHLFHGTVHRDALAAMGKGEHALPELSGKSTEQLTRVLERAQDIGLLTRLAPARFAIDPALPWFLRQMFARCYNGRQGRSTADETLRAWVKALSAMGDYYYEHSLNSHLRPHPYPHGKDRNGPELHFIHLEFANLQHARRIARRQGWQECDLPLIKGLDVVCWHHQDGRSEWPRLVAEITPDYCTADGFPIPGREGEYGLIMGYRVGAARAAVYKPRKPGARPSAPPGPSSGDLQEKKVIWCRQQAAPALALPPDVPLDAAQRNCIRDLGASLFALGEHLRLDRNPQCVAAFEESLDCAQRIRDTAEEARIYITLGCIYHNLYYQITAVRNLDAAEAAYRRSLALRDPNDAEGRASCINLVGQVHYDRFNDSRLSSEPAETVLKHFQAAEKNYLEAIALCPETAFRQLEDIHNHLADLYQDLGEIDLAGMHYERVAQLKEQYSGRYGAASTRCHLGNMYAGAARDEAVPARRRELLIRARTNAAAALQRGDMHPHFSRHKCDEWARGLLDYVEKELAKLQE
jgi:tetratricopeptide (TPR) repeat protein